LHGVGGGGNDPAGTGIGGGRDRHKATRARKVSPLSLVSKKAIAHPDLTSSRVLVDHNWRVGDAAAPVTPCCVYLLLSRTSILCSLFHYKTAQCKLGNPFFQSLDAYVMLLFHDF
jgi:hypothetical protein